jgi:hypothetical protein
MRIRSAPRGDLEGDAAHHERGRVVYSTRATSGALPAREAVRSLAEESLPPPASVYFPWTSGFAAFQTSTTLWDSALQAQ